jgi:Ion channel
MLQFFKIILKGQAHSRPNTTVTPAIEHQWENVKKVWHNVHYVDFGLERLLRLFLVVSLFFFPGLYIKQMAGSRSLLTRKLAIDAYVLTKLIFPLLCLANFWYANYWIMVITGYLLMETTLYLMSLVFLSTEVARPVSYKRSLVAVFINYIELCLSFAVIYNYCYLHIPHFFNHQNISRLKIVYFSFVSAATIGYGDLAVSSTIGYLLVIFQTLVFLLFIVLFLNFFAGRVHDPSQFIPRHKPTQNNS